MLAEHGPSKPFKWKQTVLKPELYMIQVEHPSSNAVPRILDPVPAILDCPEPCTRHPQMPCTVYPYGSHLLHVSVEYGRQKKCLPRRALPVHQCIVAHPPQALSCTALHLRPTTIARRLHHHLPSAPLHVDPGCPSQDSRSSRLCYLACPERPAADDSTSACGRDIEVKVSKHCVIGLTCQPDTRV